MYEELLEIARGSINAEFIGQKMEVSDEIKKKYSEKKACFVTLTLNGELRGCIGSLEARQELWKDVVHNSKYAAFGDPRFLPLTEKEFSRIKIELSILTRPRELKYNNYYDLINKIDDKMGLILKKRGRNSTFLPQVWEQIPDKQEFLEHLAKKAGLSKDDWKDAEYWYYRVIKVEEK